MISLDADLPKLLTGWTQTIYYALTIRAGDPKPQPGTPRYNKHRRRIYITVIALYLLYTIYEAHWEIRRDGDFYADLGVDPDVEEKGIKSRFRRIAAQHHPDKVAHTADRSSESRFVALKEAQEVLTDPTKRFAYDRLGPDSMTWQHMSIPKDYLFQWIQIQGVYYMVGLLLLFILGAIGVTSESGRYVRPSPPPSPASGYTNTIPNPSGDTSPSQRSRFLKASR